MTYTSANVQLKTPDDGQTNCPNHVEFLDKNKFGKLVRLLVLLKIKMKFRRFPLLQWQLILATLIASGFHSMRSYFHAAK
jgi:hypothetical protein